MLAVVTEFGGEKLSAFTDPTKLLDNLQSSINLGKDGIISFAESHGLKKKKRQKINKMNLKFQLMPKHQ